jgi:Glycosyl transferase family 2
MKMGPTFALPTSPLADGQVDIRVPEPREPSPAELFLLEGARQARRRRRETSSGAGSGHPRRGAVLTMVHNEPVFLPIWLRYYSRYFGPDDIYVLDHDTTDGSTNREGFVRIPVSHGSVDHTWMVRTVESHQRELLDSYDVVLVTDVDEIVAPRPECGTLADYMDGFDEEFVNCFGYEVVHLVDREGPFDRSRRVLDQRGYWFPSHAYSKPALTATPTRWIPGFHTREDGRTELDPDLCMVHLHRMDYELCLARHRYRRSRRWNERDLAENWARQNLIVDEPEFSRWFYEDNTLDDLEVVVQAIPASWRGLF